MDIGQRHFRLHIGEELDPIAVLRIVILHADQCRHRHQHNFHWVAQGKGQATNINTRCPANASDIAAFSSGQSTECFRVY